MLHKKRIAAVLLLGFFLGNGLFADEFAILDEILDGDMLNGIINRYVTNITNLMADSTSIQNVWSCPPGDVWFGLGLNGSITLADRTEVSRIDKGGGGFGGRNIDLTQIPEGLPYLPAAAIDIRIRMHERLDLGLAGMFINPQWLPILQEVLGEDADFTYATVGLDIRYAIINSEGRFFIGNKGHPLLPAVSFQAGYYFSYMNSAFTTGNSEEMDVEFRTDSYAFSLQASKYFGLGDFFGLTPYIGLRYIISSTNTSFSWTTSRPVKVMGKEYADGVTYHSGDELRDPKSYFQIYGGTGITLLGYRHILTLGFAYNIVTEHFGINAGLRFML